MAYEFKKLSEVDAAESASDGANILVEDGGTIKRVPAAAIVPEIEIPEVPEIDLSEYAKKDELFSGEWEDISNKPLVEVYGDTLTWDGDTSGKENYGVTFKVSDAVPTFYDVMNGGTISFSNGNTMAIGSAVKPADLTHEIYVYSDNIIIVKEGHPTKEPGTYLYRSGDTYATSLTLNGYDGFPAMVPLCQEFLDNVATKQEVFDNVTHWDDIPGKPTYPYMGNELTTVYAGDMSFTYISSINAYRGNVPTTAAVVKYGKPVAVYIDGVEYVTDTWNYFERGVASTPTVVCGNGAIAYGDYVYEDTGEPFCIEMSSVDEEPDYGANVTALQVYVRTQGKHSIVICAVERKEMEAPIDQKYFDEIVATREYVDEKAGESGNLRPDWEENDVGSPEYIFNRPFYAEEETVRVIPEHNVTQHDDEYNPETCTAYGHDISDWGYPIEHDTQYRVRVEESWFDVSSVGVILQNEDYTNVVVIGNQALLVANESWYAKWWPGDAVDSGEPFVICYRGERDRITFIWDKSFGETVEFTVFEDREVVKTIDPKFIPTATPTIFTRVWSDEIGDYTYVCSKTHKECLEDYNNMAFNAFVVQDEHHPRYVCVHEYSYEETNNKCLDYTVRADGSIVQIFYFSDGTTEHYSQPEYGE